MSALDREARVFVAGATGLVGSAIVRRLRALGFARIVAPPRADLDLADADATMRRFLVEKPSHVFLAAARVGGIHANQTRPADFLVDNLRIQDSVFAAALATGVQRLLFMGSSCVYPRLAPQPIREEALLTGPLEATNRAYAVAKIAGIETCRAFNAQHGTRWIAAMPTNLYGPGDNYHPTESHVLPALLRRFEEARRCGAETVTVWGTGRPLREFLHVDDCASACVHLLGLPEAAIDALVHDAEAPALVNVGAGSEVTIAELADLIARVVDFRGRIVFDESRPDGTPRKLLDCTRLAVTGWAGARTLAEGLPQAWRDYATRHPA